MTKEFYYAKLNNKFMRERAEELREKYGVSLNDVLYETKNGEIWRAGGLIDEPVRHSGYCAGNNCVGIYSGESMGSKLKVFNELDGLLYTNQRALEVVMESFRDRERKCVELK